MRIKTLLILAATGLVLGCSLEEVQTWGNVCPPRDADNYESLSLSYIGTPECRADNLGACDVSEMANKNIGLYFETRNCPPEFKNCIEDGDGVGYHCEKDTITKCADGQILCKDDDGNYCLDPSASITCGASSCTDKGQNCLEDGLTCEEITEGNYACINKQNNKIVCGDKEIDLSQKKTCGASNCNEDDNYGGKDCSEFGVESFCGLNSQTEHYECKCPDSYIICDGKCVNPNSNREFCGASGECSSDDPDDANYRGVNCTEDGVCQDGKCGCYDENKVWCVIDGMNDDQPRCYSRSTEETCNAKLSEDLIHCEYEPCEAHNACKPISATEFFCTLDSCENDEQLCSSGNDKQCYSLTDVNHCGNCSKDCTANSYKNIGNTECVEDSGEYICTYICTEGLTNCGSETSPECFDLHSSSMHCGDCDTKCEGSSYCEDGSCHESLCLENQCTSKDANGHSICVNNDVQCGKECLICKDSQCIDGTCVIESCHENKHPIFNSKGQIIECEDNSKTRCAASDINVGDEIFNCDEMLTENVAETECTSAGACRIKTCNENYHLSEDGLSCVVNTQDKCGARNSSTTANCTGIANSIKTQCIAGVCAVTECAAGYHLNSGKTGCDANSNASCAPVNSNTPTNCTTIAHIASGAGTCSNGACTVSSCASGYHLNSGKTGCVANSSTSCAPVNSNTPTNCTTIAHIASGAGTCSNGACTVSSCASGYHLNSGKTGCDANSNTSCAPVNSNTPTNCTTIAHIASGAGTCSNGACTVSSCASGYHLNSGKTGCDANSNTSCAPVNSNSPQNCTTIAHIASGAGTCSNGACTVSSCASGYHLNSGKTGCDANSNTSCAPVNSNTPTNCTTIANIASGAGTCSNGACTVSSCASGYHLNSGKTGCTANSNTSCAPVNSNSPQNCTTIAHIASGAGTCSNGACTVSACASGYHLNSGKTGCDANSNTNCAPVNSNTPTNCTSGVAKICSASGTCVCSADGSTVLNFNGSTCIRKACEGFYGATADTCGKTRCIPTSCAEGFKLDGSCSGGWSACRPLCNTNADCNALPGWVYGTCNSGVCGSGLSCEYYNYHNTCQPKEFAI